MADVKDGHVMRIYMDDVAITKETKCTLKISKESREVRHKDQSGSWTDQTGTFKSAEVTADALYAEGESLETLFTAFDAGTSVTIVVGDDTQGNKAFSGEFEIMSMDFDATDNESVSYNFSAKSKGAITRVTLS